MSVLLAVITWSARLLAHIQGLATASTSRCLPPCPPACRRSCAIGYLEMPGQSQNSGFGDSIHTDKRPARFLLLGITDVHFLRACLGVENQVEGMGYSWEESTAIQAILSQSHPASGEEWVTDAYKVRKILMNKSGLHPVRIAIGRGGQRKAAYAKTLTFLRRSTGRRTAYQNEQWIRCLHGEQLAEARLRRRIWSL